MTPNLPRRTREALLLLVLPCLPVVTVGAEEEASPFAGGGQATPAASLRLRDSFSVELLRSAGVGEGSWISMAVDDRGRWLLGRELRGIVRVTLGAEGSETQIEVVDDTLRHCRGLLYAHGSLYVSATDSRGFYRLRDTDGDDRFDDVELLQEFRYEARYLHGPNQVVEGPDGWLYLVLGNDVYLPEDAAATSPYQDPRDDLLLPNPHDAGQGPRVGYVVRTDPDGKTWEVLAGGLRNPYDLAFNADGELFTFDADMEWDVGLPWYRPVRVNHVVSGGEYGWRWGTGKWPAYRPDSLPSTVDVGIGSPTGLAFGTHSQFPPPYRDALFMGEWQHGRILLCHLEPRGASYTGEFSSFMEGSPLNVTDLQFGPDGALYFITGGRRAQSGLYRVRYVGPQETSPPASAAPLLPENPAPAPAKVAAAKQARQARAIRRELERYHRHPDAAAIAAAWPHLSSSDPWLRHAARLVLERQELADWQAKALAEPEDSRAVVALLALARVGRPEDQSALLARLGRVGLRHLDRDRLLTALRVYGLTFLRQGTPGASARAEAVAHLDDLYPHTSRWVSQELCELLVYLQAPKVIERTLARVRLAPSQEEQIHAVKTLVRARDGWTVESRREVFEWFLQARGLRGGNLLQKDLKNLERDLRAALGEAERAELAEVLAALDKPKAVAQAPIEAVVRPLVRQWKVEDFKAELKAPLGKRSHAAGKRAFSVASCIQCHRFGEDGRATGPDLTHVGRRFDARAVLESILEPSAVVDQKYQPTTYVLDDGRVLTGLATSVETARITVDIDPLSGKTEVIERSRIQQSFPASVSPMPSGLVDVLTRDEILDLIAFLRSDVVP